MKKFISWVTITLYALGSFSGALVPVAVYAQSPVAQTGPCYVFIDPLKVGSYNEAVRQLQMFLNTSSDTQVSVVGAGSRGNETQFFGPATQRAVIKFQEKYRSEVLTPAGLTGGTGFVGVLTRSKINALMNCRISTSLNIISPASGENLKKGDVKNITWTEKYQANSGASAPAMAKDTTGLAQVSISVIPNSTVNCIQGPCPGGQGIVYTIASNQSVAYTYSSFSYPWTVGQAQGGPVPNGNYKIQVCITNTSMCGLSDAFTISGGTVSTSNPVIDSMTPSMGAIGTNVTLYGRNFTGNETVYFGAGIVPQGNIHPISSSGYGTGSGLTFTVPNYLNYNCNCPVGVLCVCPAMAQQVMPGVYGVFVSNSTGPSNAFNFTVTQ